MPETNKETLLLEKLRKQSSQTFLAWFQRYLRNPPLSLRMLEHFVSSYSKRHNTSYLRPVPGSKEPKMFTVHASYKAQVKAYSRTLFDAFCRRQSKPVVLPSLEARKARPDETETCAAQLNYFHWIYKNGILDQALKIKDKLIKDGSVSRRPPKTASKSVTKTIGPKRAPVAIAVPRGASSLHLTFK